MTDDVSDLVGILSDTARRYGLKTLYLDATDATLIARIGISQEIFIQIYANVKKEKLNMALVVAGERIYGVDKEGGFYHKHPFGDPASHVVAKKAGVEEFIIMSLELLSKMNLI